MRLKDTAQIVPCPRQGFVARRRYLLGGLALAAGFVLAFLFWSSGTPRSEMADPIGYDVALVLAGGFILLFLLGCFMQVLASTHQKAFGLTHEMLASLHENERHAQRLSVVARRTENAVIIFQPDGAIEWVNSAFLRLMQHREEDVLGQNLWTILHAPEEEANRMAYLRGQLREGGGFQGEIVLYDKSRQRHVVIMEVRPILNETNELSGFVVILNDITSRAAAESALRESEHFATYTVDALAEHVCIIKEDGRVLAVNRAWHEFAKQNAATMSAVSEGTNYLKVCAAADNAGLEDGARMAKAINDIITGKHTSLELEYPCDSPTERRWFSARVTRFAGDGPIRVVIAHQNITERKLIEEELRQQKEILSSVLEHIPYSIFWKDRNLIYLGCNRNFAHEAGLSSPREIIGKSDYDLPWKREEAECYRRGDQLVMQEGRAKHNIEETQLRGDGSEVVILTSKVPLRDSTGRVIGILGIYLDLTERKRQEEIERDRKSLREAVTSFERVLGVVGHELRTPLASVRAIAELLITDVMNVDETQKFLQSLHDETILMTGVVNDLLEVARLNSGTARWNWGEVVVERVAEAALTSVRPLMDLHRVSLNLDVKPESLTMLGDADAIRRLILNLVNNATKNTTDGSITVRVRRVFQNNQFWVELHVIDTGRGMNRETAARLGEAFALNSGVVGESHVQGSGLGLAVCKGIVAAHGGTISVSSILNKGTTIKVLLRKELADAITDTGSIRIAMEEMT